MPVQLFSFHSPSNHAFIKNPRGCPQLFGQPLGVLFPHSLPGCLATPPVGVFHYQTSPGQSHARCLGHCYRYCYVAGLQLVQVIHGDDGDTLADAVSHQALEAGDVPVIRAWGCAQALDGDDQDLLAGFGCIHPALSG